MYRTFINMYKNNASNLSNTNFIIKIQLKQYALINTQCMIFLLLIKFFHALTNGYSIINHTFPF